MPALTDLPRQRLAVPTLITNPYVVQRHMWYSEHSYDHRVSLGETEQHCRSDQEKGPSVTGSTFRGELRAQTQSYYLPPALSIPI